MINFKILLKRAVGIFLVIFGFIALLIPFFPFAWVAFIGFELLGIRILSWDKIKSFLRKIRIKNHENNR